MCHHTLSLISSLPQVFKITPGCVTVGFPCCLTLVKLQKLLWSCLDRFLACSAPPDLAGVPFQSVELTRCRRPYVVTSATKITACWVAMSYFAVKRQDTPPQHLRGSNLPMPNIHKQGIFLYTHVAYFHTHQCCCC